jgi:tRNA G10  N-methylase Trm11
MSDFIPKSLCLLGRQPALGLAELESLYGSDHVRWFGDGALLDIEVDDISFKRLGGTIKVAKVLNTNVGKTWRDVENYLVKTTPDHLQHLPEGKFTLGVSAYGIEVSPKQIEVSALKMKKIIRSSGHPVRVVPNKEPALSSAQVIHNQLTHRGGWELILASSGGQIMLAQTFFVQDIESYAARDQARPARDARVGMLPPKLAQIIVNLANPPKDALVLDPFCGTGVVLQEALIMNYMAAGTDLEPRMVEYSKTNLDWLSSHYSLSPNSYSLESGDATNHKWSGKIDAVASETYLGRALSGLPSAEKLNEIIQDVNTILEKFLKNIAPQIKPGTPLCLAVPAWQDSKGNFSHLPLIDHLGVLGYNRKDFRHVRAEDLLYYREGQTVARQLIVLSVK